MSNSIDLILNEIKNALGYVTDDQLATAIGITKANLSQWRRRNSMDVNKVATALPSVSADYLLRVNSVSVHLRNLRTVVNLAIDDELTEVYGFRRYQIKSERTRHRNLTPEEFRALLQAPVTEDEERFRDIFLLGFLLIGINIVDMAGLTEIDHGRINYRRAKTGRLYSIKVEPEALEIIERHRGVTHLLREFDAYSDHRNYSQHINRSLGRMGGTEIGKKGKRTYHPLYPDLTYYWCRHTWATAAANIGISRDTIKLALGHGATETMDTYVDYDLKLVDEANRRVIDWVLYGKK